MNRDRLRYYYSIDFYLDFPLQSILTHTNTHRNANDAFPRPTPPMPCTGTPIAMHALVIQPNLNVPLLILDSRSPFRQDYVAWEPTPGIE